MVKKPKPHWEKTFDCPHCKKSIHIRIEKERTNEPVPAEYDLKEIIEKANQSTLEADRP
jgi:transcription elongation factor Elf1